MLECYIPPAGRSSADETANQEIMILFCTCGATPFSHKTQHFFVFLLAIYSHADYENSYQ